MNRTMIESALIAHPRFGASQHLLTSRAIPDSTRGNLTQARAATRYSVTCAGQTRPVLDSQVIGAWPALAEHVEQFATVDLNTPAGQLAELGTVELAQLQRGATLLEQVMPLIGPDAWACVHAVAVLQTGGMFRSTTLRDLVGIVLLDLTQLSSPWHTAELLLHEALHAKLELIQSKQPLVSPTCIDHPQHITAVWHGRAGKWPIPRALAAFHVYAHLVAFADAVRTATPDLDYGEQLFSQALFRAHFLGRELTRQPDLLTADGAELVVWLLGLLPSPKPLGTLQQYLITNGLPR